MALQSQNGHFTPVREWPPFHCRPSQVRWCLAMLVLANIFPQLEHSPLSLLCTLSVQGGLSPSLHPGLLLLPRPPPFDACTGFACSSMPRYIVLRDILATCPATLSTGILRSHPHAPFFMVLPVILRGKTGIALAACKYLPLLHMHSHLVDSESTL